MKLGLGLYRHMLTPENFRFARQAGATHIVAHWVDYFHSGPRIPQSESDGQRMQHARCWPLAPSVTHSTWWACNRSSGSFSCSATAIRRSPSA